MSLEDPRQRTRVFLLTYLDPSAYPAMGHIYWDDAETEATYACMYTKPNIPLKLLYYGNKNYDVIFCIGAPDNTPIRDWQHKTIGYQENVPITICAIDKDGLTAQLALWQAEMKLRKIVETYFSGSLRTLRRTKPNQTYLGGFFEYTVECEIGYLRSTDTVPTIPSVTWGTSASPTGTYVFPNMTAFSMDPISRNAHLDPPSRMSSIIQKLGMPDYMITTSHDLDVEPENLTWKRAQTTSSKTDIVKWQVFLEIQFNGQSDGTQPYQTMNLGWGSTIKVVLEGPVKPTLTGDRHTLDLTWYVYSTTNQSNYKTYYGINP